MLLSRRDLLACLGAAGLVGAARPARAESARPLIWLRKTQAEFARSIEEALRDGYRVRSLALYGPRSAPLYAALLAKSERPVAQRCTASLSLAELKREIERSAKDGFAPSIIVAIGPPAEPRFAAVLEPQASAPLVRLDLKSGGEKDANTIQGAIQSAKLHGLILRSLAPYGTGAEPRFAAIFVPNDAKVAWELDGIGDDARLFRERLAAQTAGWCRLAFVSRLPDGRFASMYHLDSIGAWSVAENLDTRGFEHEVDRHAVRGLRPIALQASGGDTGAARLTAVFARSDVPTSPQWSATGPLAHAAIDDAMRRIMSDAMIRAASLAIVKGPRLVFARGYTYAPPDWPVTTPTTTFRLASVSKTVAALGIYQAIEAGRLRLDDRMQDILQLRGIAGEPPKDPRLGKITIEHLLNHTSGLSTSILSSQSVHAAHVAAAPHRAWHYPITASMANAVIASSRLASEPGAHYGYNNCAYYVLGQIVAKVGGTATALETYEKQLFAPLGITRIRRARSLIADQPPDEARYRVCLGAGHVRILPVVRSMMSDAHPLVPLGYGNGPLEMHEGDAGLSAAMPDLARLVAIMLTRADTPALRRATMREMLANAAARRGHGLDGAQVRGDDAYFGYKFGAFASAWSLLQLDGEYGFCVAWSGGIPKDWAGEWTKWPAHLPTVMDHARRAAWGEDLFPQFGMKRLG